MSEWFSGIKAKFILDFIADQRWKYITDGLKVTLEVTFLALILGLVLGAVIAVIRTTHDQLKEDQSKGFGSFLIKLADLICRVYLTVIRGTPTMVQLLIMFFIVLASSNNKVMVAVITFGVNSGAYVAEIFRSGIMSVDKGQMEAARSLGLPYFKAMRRVILPQAFLTMLPSMINQFIITLKDTSLISIIGIRELTQNGKIIAANAASMVMSVWLVVALFYLVVCTILAKFAKIVERKIAYGRK